MEKCKTPALEELTVEEFKKFNDRISDDVYPILEIKSILEKRCAKGGVSLDRIYEAVKYMENHLASR